MPPDRVVDGRAYAGQPNDQGKLHMRPTSLGQALTSGAAPLLMTWTDPQANGYDDIAGFSTSTNAYTVRAAGLYDIHFVVGIDTGAASQASLTGDIEIQVNGSTVNLIPGSPLRQFLYKSNTLANQIALCELHTHWRFFGGDVLTFYVRQTNTGAVGMATNTSATYVALHWLSMLA